MMDEEEKEEKEEKEDEDTKVSIDRKFVSSTEEYSKELLKINLK